MQQPGCAIHPAHCTHFLERHARVQDDKEEEDMEHLKCSICLGLCDRPVTAPCQHNYCLKCFRKWVNQGKKQCPTCRAQLTSALINNPRINTMLTVRIRQAQKVS
jgi:Zinc finger, C3HC4 type (RING finger)